MIEKTILMLATAFVLASCNGNANKTTVGKDQPIHIKHSEEETQLHQSDYSGDYVTDTYNKRNEGYDWLAVSVKNLTDSTMHFSIRSRSDKKEATCSFDGDGVKVGEGIYKAKGGDYFVLFTFKGDQLTIGGEGKPDDASTLHWYCSGGASLSDYTFTKISAPLDETQLEQK